MYKPPLKSSLSLLLMYLASFFLCITFGTLLIQIGTPENYVNLLMFALIIGGYFFSGFFGKTMLLPIFQTAQRTGASFYVGQSIAAGLISSGVYILLAGDFYQNGTDALTIFSGLILGVSLMTLLFAAPINRSNNTTLASLLTQENNSKLLRLITTVTVVIASLLLLYVQLSAIGHITETYFNIASEIGVLLAVFSIGICLIMGGIQSLTIIRILAYPILLVTFLTPIIWIAYKLTGNPIPQLSFGAGALQAITEINQEMLSTGFAQKEDIFQITSDGLNYDFSNHFAALICIAFGTASMPHLLQHFRTLPKARDARKAGVWGLGFLLIILTTIPAVAAFVKLDIYTALLGFQLSDLAQEAQWVFALNNNNNNGIIKICGAVAYNAADVIAACGQSTDYFLSTKDITLNADMLTLTSGAMNGLPDLITTMLAIGGLLAIWTTADGLIFVIANTMTEDIYRGILRPKSPMGTRLFMTRVFITLIIGVCSYLVLYHPFDTKFAFAACFAISTATLFPVLTCKLYIKKVSDKALSWGSLISLALTVATLFLSHFGYDFIAQSGDELSLYIPNVTAKIQPLSIGLIGMIISFIVTITISKAIEISTLKSKAKVDVPA